MFRSTSISSPNWIIYSPYTSTDTDESLADLGELCGRTANTISLALQMSACEEAGRVGLGVTAAFSSNPMWLGNKCLPCQLIQGSRQWGNPALYVGQWLALECPCGGHDLGTNSPVLNDLQPTCLRSNRLKPPAISVQVRKETGTDASYKDTTRLWICLCLYILNTLWGVGWHTAYCTAICTLESDPAETHV